MNDFIQRNKPVFIIAVITLVVFVAIIILAQFNTPKGPTLRRIENVQLLEPHTYTKGSKEPKLVLIEFSDYQCPACKALNPVINQLGDKYAGYMAIAFRHFPLPQHQNAKIAAIAAQAAGTEGKFWEYSEKLFANQENLDRDSLVKYAEELGLNVEQFKRSLNDEKYKKEVEIDTETGLKIGLQGTPSLIINKNLVEFNSAQELEELIINELKAAGVALTQTTNQQDQTTSSAKVETQPTLQASSSQTVGTTAAGIVEIYYTQDGFTPNNLKLNINQPIKFINTTDKQISIRQLIQKYSNYYPFIKINPQEAVEIVMSKSGLWTFKEDSVRHYGSIFVEEGQQ